MDELKELLQAISKQLADIDFKLGLIANNAQGPMVMGGTRYNFGGPAHGTIQTFDGGIAADPAGRPRT